jgi:radical SAM protein with 4Fe4S-binding SPASM domain
MGRSMRLAARDRRPRLLEVELTHRCAGGCIYCFASSRPDSSQILDLDVMVRVLDEAAGLGVRMIWWVGGDPLFHPRWSDLVEHAGRLRMAQTIASSGLIPMAGAQRLTELKDLVTVSIHLDTVDAETYALINRMPGTLKAKMDGYRRLLMAGFPSGQVSGVVTLTRPVVDGFGPTVDWFMEEMGAAFVLIRVFKPLGMGAEAAHLEPSLDEVRRCQVLRDAKFHADLPFPSSDLGPYVCRSNVGIHPDGEVVPCLFLSGQGLGNINEERFSEIVARHRDRLFFNFEVEGPCRTCASHLDPEIMCMGCRINALAYTGDLRGSDPKCWRNPEARQLYLDPAGDRPRPESPARVAGQPGPQGGER